MAALLSTGKVAQLCSVKPDTVLKWIKKGRIAAIRTAGGHYRVDQTALEPLLASPESEEGKAEHVAGPHSSQPLRCWEYMSNTVTDRCRNCAAYRTRAVWCFELAKMLRGSGHEKVLCTGPCQECPYYRRVHHLPCNVLVITRDELLIQHLAKHSDACVSFRYARSGYDASAIIAVFRPALVVLDSNVANGNQAELAEALKGDERVPGVRVLLAVREGDSSRVQENPVIAGTVPVPFGCEDISTWLERLPVEALPEEN